MQNYGEQPSQTLQPLSVAIAFPSKIFYSEGGGKQAFIKKIIKIWLLYVGKARCTTATTAGSHILPRGTRAEVAQEAQRLQTNSKVITQPWLLTTWVRVGKALSLLPPGTKDAIWLWAQQYPSIFIKEEMETSYLVPAFSKSTALKNGDRISLFTGINEDKMCPP